MNQSRLSTVHSTATWRGFCLRAVRPSLPAMLACLPVLAYSSDANTNMVPADLTALSLESLMQIEVPKVYAASKIEQKVTQAPASITVVTADEVKKFGYRTLGDVLQSVPGFNVSNDHNYDFVGTRGVSLGDFNDRILLLVDGHRVNNNFNDGAFFDSAFLLDLDLVDRVEVIRGPSAVLYGNNAFFGVVNVITRTGAQINGVEAAAGYASFDTYKARVSLGKQFTNGVEMLLSGTYYKSDGNPSFYYPAFDPRLSAYQNAANNGLVQNMDGDESASFFGSLIYRDFSVEGAFNHREKADPTGYYFGNLINDPRLKWTDEQGYAALKYAHSFAQDLDVTARFYYDTYTHLLGYPFTQQVFYLERDTGQWWGTEVQVNKRLWDKHTITIGAEYRDDFKQQQQLTGPGYFFRDDRNRQSDGVYLQSDIELLQSLHFDGGVRYDQYGDFNPAYDPRLALIYNPVESSTFKAIYGTAFRAPNFNELTASQNLQPETITSYELDYDQQLGSHLRSSLSGYYNQMENLIVFNNGSYENFNADTTGMEIALEGTWTNGIHGRASYSLQHTKDYTVAWDMPDSPTHMVKFNVSVPLYPDKIFAGLEIQYTSGRHSLTSFDSSGVASTTQGLDASGFALVNFTLFSQHLIKNLDCSASIYNLLDREHAVPASQFHVQTILPQDGRSFRFNVTYHF